MPKFTYTAKINPYKSIQGEIEADSEQEVINKLAQAGYFPLTIKPKKNISGKQTFLKLRKIPRKDLAGFTQQLSTLVGSGVNIVNGLAIASDQSSNKYLAEAIDDVVGKIKDGKSLSASLAAHPEIFNNLYISLIHSGEAGGTLEATLKNLAEFLESDEEFRNSVSSALIYPVFVLVVGIFTIMILLGFVIPRLASMFEDMGQLLPLPTRILINISGFLQARWWLILAAIAASILTFKRSIASNKGKFIWDKLKLRTAILGNIILKAEVSRLSRTLSLLLSGGVSMISSLEISSTVIENEVLKKAMLNATGDISSGASFCDAIKKTKVFPDFMIHIVSIGEETGRLDKALLRISEDYAREVDRNLKNISRLLEPLIILGIGLVVGFIVLAMLLPIFQINLIVR